MITGSKEGSAWGTDVYSDDSDLAVAAVHAGVVNPNERKMIIVQICPGQSIYQGSARNGVTTSSFGAWEGSYSFPENPGTPATIVPNLATYRDKVGETFSFTITGDTEGSVWGTDVYTDDSNLAVAAVHAGIVNEGESKLVAIQMLPGLFAYQGGTRNGVTTSSYAEWDGSFFFCDNPVTTAILVPNLKAYRDRVGQVFSWTITGRTEGPVWGTDIYTDDSNLAVAAVHAGIVAEDEEKLVSVQILPGQPTYEGSLRNGISSSSYDVWEGSYSFVTEKDETVQMIQGKDDSD